jgi:hypothetical protein
VGERGCGCYGSGVKRWRNSSELCQNITRAERCGDVLVGDAAVFGATVFDMSIETGTIGRAGHY